LGDTSKAQLRTEEYVRSFVMSCEDVQQDAEKHKVLMVEILSESLCLSTKIKVLVGLL
jgi:hypothetical protein